MARIFFSFASCLDVTPRVSSGHISDANASTNENDTNLDASASASASDLDWEDDTPLTQQQEDSKHAHTHFPRSAADDRACRESHIIIMVDDVAIVMSAARIETPWQPLTNAAYRHRRHRRR
ncbi:hypothetical protein CMUS01_02065 [Colletotrichum musicola]|uniref:Uncharacterized protein n=1 Tax=Colletotrichum musicola TaxID=2175873 RepID=A0A8H6NVQ9_9PEZI|nr:hypothetical protein CMUS01_02065 [Colletotrichum musicola]